MPKYKLAVAEIYLDVEKLNSQLYKITFPSVDACQPFGDFYRENFEKEIGNTLEAAVQAHLESPHMYPTISITIPTSDAEFLIELMVPYNELEEKAAQAETTHFQITLDDKNTPDSTIEFTAKIGDVITLEFSDFDKALKFDSYLSSQQLDLDFSAHINEAAQYAVSRTQNKTQISFQITSTQLNMVKDAVTANAAIYANKEDVDSDIEESEEKHIDNIAVNVQDPASQVSTLNSDGEEESEEEKEVNQNAKTSETVALLGQSLGKMFNGAYKGTKNAANAAINAASKAMGNNKKDNDSDDDYDYIEMQDKPNTVPNI